MIKISLYNTETKREKKQTTSLKNFKPKTNYINPVPQQHKDKLISNIFAFGYTQVNSPYISYAGLALI